MNGAGPVSRGTTLAACAVAGGRRSSWRFALVALVAALVSICASPSIAATTTYTGVYAGGTIASGNTVLLNNGAAVTGNVVANGTLQFNQTNALSISSTISGTGTLSLTNTGTLTLTASAMGANTYASDMSNSVSSGWLTVGSSGAGTMYLGVSGTGTLTVSGGNVTSGTGYIGGFFAGSAGSATVSSGTWANSGNLMIGGNPGNNFMGTGGLTISGSGVVIVGGTLSKGVYGTINLNRGGILQIGTGTLGGVLFGGTGSFVSNGTIVFNRSNASTYSGGISGAGALAKQGTGVLTLSGSNAYTGGTTINSGIIAVPVGGQISHSVASMIIGQSAGDAGTLSLSGGYISTGAGFFGVSAGSVGTATVVSGTWANSGNLTVGLSGTGVLTMAGGLVTVGGSLGRGAYGTINLNAGGTLQIGVGGTTGVLATSLTNNGTLIFNRSDYSTYSGLVIGSGTLIKLGEGTLDLTGTSGGLSTIAIDTNMDVRAGRVAAMLSAVGTLRVGASGTGTLSVSGGTVLTGYGDLGYSAGSIGTATVTSGTWGNGADLRVGYDGTGWLQVDGGSVTARNYYLGVYGQGTGAISSGTLTASGDLVVGGKGAGALTVSGGLVTVGGTLSRGVNGTISLQPGGSLQIGIGGTTGVLATSLTSNGTLVFNRSDSSTYAGILSGSGTISKQGAGTITFSGPNTLTGPTTIQRGTLQLAHASALSSSMISPLSGGALTLTPGLQATVGSLDPNAGGLVDVGTGMITVARGLSSLALVYALQSGRAGGSWAGATGITSSVAATSSGSRTLGWLDNGNGSVSFAYAAPGDTNLDWSVDILDVGNLLAMGRFDTGLPATWIEGDFSYDGVVDILDVADFFATGLYDAGVYNAPAGTIAAVPEPSTLGFVGVGAGTAWLLARRRERSA